MKTEEPKLLRVSRAAHELGLREIGEPDGTRYAVLDFIIEVPGESSVTFEEIQTVLGFDWGVRCW